MAGIRALEAKIKAAMLVDEAEIIGKTVAVFNWTYTREILVGFTDQTFILFEVKLDRDECIWKELITSPREVSPGTAQLVGVLTEEEAVQLTQLRRKSAQDSARSWERRRYEELKRKFEGGE